MDADKYIGRLLDNRYEILEVIGVGGMAVVYKARCHRLNRLVAIKILKDDLSEDEEFRRRFHAESQAVAMLSHPNIVAVYDVSTSEEADYIVMELIDGITLKQYMEKKGVLNWKETLHFSMQIAKALEHAHSRGIVHRDIKPHNVMVLKNGSVKVTDFGIARIISKSNTLTKEALGSVHYISPEQAKGGRVDNRSDIYSLGVVMYEMMTGRPPYDGESPVAVAIQHINGGATMPSVLNPNIPGGLEQIIMKAMAVDPDKRYNTATELLYDLEEFRKNPSMLFDFNNTPVDDATTRIQGAATAAAAAATAAQPPRTTAERVAGVRTDRPQQPRPAAQPQTRPRPQGQQPAQPESRPQTQRPSREEPEAPKEGRNRAVMTAVVTCSAVAVVAIVIFLIVLLNGGLTGNHETLVAVPELVGKVYQELNLKAYPNVQISVGDYGYSEKEPGIIYEQNPAAGTQVPIGSEVKIYISMGPEQEELPQLIDLVNMTPQAAKNYLNALDGEFEIEEQEENSEDIEKGYVTRTEPGAGTQLERGQKITIYVSTGPATKLAQVPTAVIGMNKDKAEKLLNEYGFEIITAEEENSLESKNTVLRVQDEDGNEITTGKELDVTTPLVLIYSSGEMYAQMPTITSGDTAESAKKMLNDLGFKNVDTQEEYSDTVPEGKVIKTSIPGGTKIDVTTAIVLTVSKGPEPTEPPKETEPPAVTKSVTIALPQDKTAAYTLVVMYQGGTIVDETIQPGTGNYVIQISGTGTGYVEIYIDGEYVRTEKVDFGA